MSTEHNETHREAALRLVNKATLARSGPNAGFSVPEVLAAAQVHAMLEVADAVRSLGGKS